MNDSKPDQDRYTEEERQAIIDGLDEEEREILDAFERGELVPTSDPEMALALRRAAENTLAEPREMTVRIRELHARLVEQRAQELGVTCDDIFQTAVEEYISRLLGPDLHSTQEGKAKPLPRAR